MPIAKTAYVDEFLRVPKGLYVLAAVIIADPDATRHRQALRELLYRRQLRLHWRDESSRRRSQLIAAVCQLRHTGAVVIAAGVGPGRRSTRPAQMHRAAAQRTRQQGDRQSGVRAAAQGTGRPRPRHGTPSRQRQVSNVLVFLGPKSSDRPCASSWSTTKVAVPVGVGRTSPGRTLDRIAASTDAFMAAFCAPISLALPMIRGSHRSMPGLAVAKVLVP